MNKGFVGLEWQFYFGGGTVPLTRLHNMLRGKEKKNQQLL